MGNLGYRVSCKRHIKDECTIRFIREICYINGYALAVHGSRGPKDLDLIAVPWRKPAVSARELVKRIVYMTKYIILCKPTTQAEKDWGRKAWMLLRPDDGRLIDLSITPKGKS